MLLYSEGITRHYCLIKDLNKLLYDQNGRKCRMYYCRYCLHGFIREDILQEHEPHCCQHGAQRIELWNEHNASLYFKDYHKQLKVPFVIYADFESVTAKIDSVSPNPTKSSTGKYQHHQPCGFSYVVVSEARKYNKLPVFTVFMNASLERLVSNLSKNGEDIFPFLQRYVESDHEKYLRNMDSVKKFDKETLPPQECFYSVLNDEHVSDADYDHATRVVEAFNCQSMGDYHDLYLKSDILLLADVFENFRNVCLKAYNLDSCHFYTSPGLA
ncbi:Gastrula zinc finger [Paramuricea clavata]|uniref:Gastrula zinc finger n=1 Tax=Paramuricea clavata TaxID=317549 RepID=A0A6S7GEE1_PARCT|nr:Gastrula zinc finger [Paramuricea clavata]